MNQDKRPVTLEDLLRLKRAERPAAEFWNEFDRELRTKQLSALMAKRPWWQTIRVGGLFARLGQHRVPLGAAAAFALTFLAIRDGHEGGSPALEPAQAVITSSESASNLASTFGSIDSGATSVIGFEISPVPVAMMAVEGEHAEGEAEEGHSNTIVAVDLPAHSEPVLGAGQLSHMIPLLGANEVHEGNTRVTSARHILASLENVEAAQLTDALGIGLLSVTPRRGFESRALPARSVAVDPLQQMTPPSDFRRSRYLSAMVSTASEDSLDRTTARMAQRISGDELYEQVQRFGTRRGGLNVKF
jgi:hypothetical protein